VEPGAGMAQSASPGSACDMAQHQLDHLLDG